MQRVPALNPQTVQSHHEVEKTSFILPVPNKTMYTEHRAALRDVSGLTPRHCHLVQDQMRGGAERAGAVQP